MACEAPTYAPEVAPPSYAEVIKNIEAAAENNATPQQLFNVIEGLSAEDRKVVSNFAKDKPIELLDEEKKAIGIAVTKGLAEPKGQELLKGTAEGVTAAAKGIKNSFQSLRLKLAELEPIAKSNFLSELQGHEKTFDVVLKESRRLAINIANYGESFDTRIVPITANKDLDVSRRLKTVESHIQKAESLQSDADTMRNRFSTLYSEFQDFVGKFSHWADVNEGDLDHEIDQLNKEISDLQEQLGRLEKSLYGMGAAVIVGGLAIRFATLSGPAAPYITAIGAVIVAGASLALIGLGIAFAETKKSIELKQAERDGSVAKRNTIKSSRGELMALGQEQLVEFHNNIDFLASYWQTVDNHTQTILGWLKDGAEDADIPDILEQSIKSSSSEYKTLATYLRAYADGLPSV